MRITHWAIVLGLHGTIVLVSFSKQLQLRRRPLFSCFNRLFKDVSGRPLVAFEGYQPNNTNSCWAVPIQAAFVAREHRSQPVSGTRNGRSVKGSTNSLSEVAYVFVRIILGTKLGSLIRTFMLVDVGIDHLCQWWSIVIKIDGYLRAMKPRSERGTKQVFSDT